RIADSGGLLLSEFPLEAGPRKAWFPRRNRLIAALGRAVVVVEGTEASGSLGTAELAQGLGRDVFAVPGPADSPLSAAPHKLLRDGAQLACEASDILLSFPLELRHAAKAAACVRAPAATAALSLPSDYKKIIESLAAEALTVDELAVGSGLSVSRLSNILFEMELQGLVSPAPGQRYAKKES
ncbi:MAG: DNA-protecting protein DprA, partial [Elusimicrobia bacterium]|nr:DNA-protecting protein DprA [Elusimicrobiota bacterium]